MNPIGGCSGRNERCRVRDAPWLVVAHFSGLISFHISQVQRIPVEVDFKYDDVSGFRTQV